MDTKYWVVDQSSLSGLDYSALEENSVATTRLSVDGTKAVIESSQTPSGLSEEDSMTHEQALSLMSTSEWYVPDPNDDIDSC